MKFSIVIPTYNRAHIIHRAIDSIISQEYDEWEIIIVDDGSNDNTEDVINSYLSDKRIRYIKKANSGAGESRNYGINFASYDIITFLDSDDEVKPQWLNTMATIFQGEKVDIAFCGLEVFDMESEKVIEIKMANPMGPIYGNVKGRFSNSGAFFMKRKVFEDIEGYDIDLKSSQHTELGFRLSKDIRENVLKTEVVDTVLLRINIHSGPRIRWDNKAKFEGVERILKIHYDTLKLNPRTLKNYLRIASYYSFKYRKISFFNYYIKYLLSKTS